MKIDIQKELEGKNPKRVLPQVKKQVELQRQRVVVYVVMAALFLCLAIAAFFVGAIPRWIQITSFCLFPFMVLGVFGDSHLYRYQKEKERLLQELIEEH